MVDTGHKPVKCSPRTSVMLRSSISSKSGRNQEFFGKGALILFPKLQNQAWLHQIRSRPAKMSPSWGWLRT